MRSTIALLTVFALIPLGVEAQEQGQEEPPRGLFVSQWQCPQNQIQWIAQMYDSLSKPIEQELVNEGMLYGAGMFFHDWADEWNVNWYRTGQDRSAVFEAIAEVGRRVDERHPEAPNMFESCRAHRDNIYWWGPRTSPPAR